MKLIGRLGKIIYEKEGFFIGLLDSGEKISGHYCDTPVESIENAAITLEGAYVEHPKYGRTFVFEKLSVNQHELFFFLNRVVKGFPKKLTAELIEKYGDKGLIDLLDNDIETLGAYTGIGPKRLEKIHESWRRFRSARELGGFLAPLGMTSAMIVRIAGVLKAVPDPVGALKKNPYVLMNVEGIGFRRADALALKTGMSPLDGRRVGAAMDYAVGLRCERDGNSCISKAVLFAALDELLQNGDAARDYETVLLERIAEGSIVALRDGLLSPVRLYEAEKFIDDELRRRRSLRDDVIVEDPDAFLAESEIELGDEQRRAVETVNAGYRSLCLVGYAGTGKSTTSRVLLDLLAKRYGSDAIITCALSGIASQRIADTTGYDGATIQSLLVRFEAKDFMPYKVVLIDECSMINAPLFASILSKCRRDSVLILVGDDAQLPPIGAGDVLGDIIALQLMPLVKLTRIYRQSADQAIAVIANDIRQGRVPDISGTYEDFCFRPVIPADYIDREMHAEAILSAVAETAVDAVTAARTYLKNRDIGGYLRTFQVVSPVKGGTLGVENLNRILQSYFNPAPKASVKKGDTAFALMDKVVHIKNENLPAWSTEGFKEGQPPQERRIFNGMCGLLFRIDTDEEAVYVVYPNESAVVRYDFERLPTHLTLAYALTVHKVQGTEYDTVVMPMSFSHTVMLNAKLLYTAITRAKKNCLVIGDPAAFTYAAKRVESLQRDTVIKELHR